MASGMTQAETNNTGTQDAADPKPEPARGSGSSDWTPEDQRRAFIRLAVIIGLGILASIATGVTKTVLVIAALIVMIMLHELGHLVMAKAAGMKVTEYFLGFGPRLWSVRKGETEYGVKAIPAGGYVRIIGMSNLEEVAPEDEPRTYRQKGYWRRMSVAVAGSTMHFIIAFALLWVLFSAVGIPDDNHPLPVVGTISKLSTGPSPAQQAGFHVGDRIVAVDGNPVHDWDSLPKYIKARPGQAITFDVIRNGEHIELRPTTVDLSKVTVDGVPAASEPTGFVGIGAKIPILKVGFVDGAGKATTGLWRFTTTTVSALGRLFSPHGVHNYASELSGRGAAKGDQGNDRFLSPVGFARIAGQAAESGMRDVLILLIAINVFVGIFNMTPLLPFDGGHAAIATYEAIRSRKGKRYFVDGRKALATAYPVVFILVLIAVTSLYLDIVRPLGSPFR
jgi:membrane-associated protease RseP (regulator of RpoE activity)